MSAWICDDAHLVAIVAWGASKDLTVGKDGRMFSLASFVDAVECIRVLRAENYRSVNELYGDSAVPPEDVDSMDLYPQMVWSPIADSLAHTALRCLSYQSCEGANYGETVACAVIEQMLEASLAQWEGLDRAERMKLAEGCSDKLESDAGIRAWGMSYADLLKWLEWSKTNAAA